MSQTLKSILEMFPNEFDLELEVVEVIFDGLFDHQLFKLGQQSGIFAWICPLFFSSTIRVRCTEFWYFIKPSKKSCILQQFKLAGEFEISNDEEKKIQVKIFR